MIREEWVLEQDRHRRLVAVCCTAALYLALFLAAWGLGLLKRAGLSDLPGTLLVNLGDFEGPPGGRPLGLETAPERPPEAPAAPPAPAAGKPSAVASAPPPAAAKPAPAKPAPVNPAASAPPPAAATPAFEPAAKPSPAPEQPRPEAAQPAAAVSPNAPTAQPDAAVSAIAPVAPPELPEPPPSKSFGSPSSAAASPAGVPGGSGSVTYRGTEKGNSLDTVFGASSGTIGRSLYVPVWGFMPLPARVPDAIYDAIPADKDGFYSAEARKKTFRQYYQDSGGEWALKSPVPLDRRLGLWLMLEDAGYDLERADYKSSLKANSVVVEFAVGPAASGSKPVLIDLSLVSSSGSKEIDEAVLYGFRQAAFFNKNAFAVSGKFTYRFGK